MKPILIWIFTFSFFMNMKCLSQDLGSNYVEKWKSFYPSKALSQGIHDAIFNYENLSSKNIKEWVSFNREMLTLLKNTETDYVKNNRIDARLLLLQVKKETEKWEIEIPHLTSVSLYVDLISGALDKVIESDFLLDLEKKHLTCARMRSVGNLCDLAINSLEQGTKKDIENSLRSLQKIKSYYQDELDEKLHAQHIKNPCIDFSDLNRSVIDKIQRFIDFLTLELLPAATESSMILGPKKYANALSSYTDSDLTPDQLATMALEEIELVKGLMVEVSKEYLFDKYPNKIHPTGNEEIIEAAFSDMEKDVPLNGKEYLDFWIKLAESAAGFVKENNIATLPENETLRIIPAPESAGAAARIGWVSSAPPFAPNPLTTLYLPSIPDTLPLQERKEFWASFNKPFNRMIVIHELIPGHYMQIKMSRESPHPIRLLYPYGPYFEGWATFCEKIVLDAGWERENKLTMLAHLRKRLENANRAYTSVMTHCHSWNEEEVMLFSTKTSLLAPQFAKSLWGRLMRSPMQMTSYFLGGVQFKNLLAEEQKRLGKDFNLKYFMDTIIKAGPIPIDEFPTIFGS